MRFIKLTQPFERDIGGSVTMVVNEIRQNQTGLVEAKVEAWNGTVLYSNIVITSKSVDRDKCTQAVVKSVRAAKIKGVKEKEVASFLLDLDIKASEELNNHAKANASTSSSKAPDDNPYRADPDGMYIIKTIADKEVTYKMANFTAEIKGDTLEDDGAETKRVFDIEAKLNGRTQQVSIPSAVFASMRWPIEFLGTSAVIFPSYQDHVRCAIQLLSNNVEQRHIYTHTGWRRINGEWFFLHAGGAIGARGAITDVSVKLGSDLSTFSLSGPPQGEDLKNAIRASLNILELAPRVITFPLLSTTYRAAIGNCDYSTHLSGPSGAGKSELAALAQQHYGAALDARHLPASWSSTANANEALAFTLKDVVMVIDDFAPTGSSTDIQRMHREADRLLRAQGNHAGRKRMRADATLRPEKYPRGSILSTGEDVPRGKSLRARLLISEVGPDDVNWDYLSQSQADASSGLLVSAMSGFIQWLAARYEAVQKRLKSQIADFRNDAAQSRMHRRTPEIVANLGIGLSYFLRFAVENGAIGEPEEEELWAEGWRCFGQAALLQSRYQSASDPVQVYLDLLQAAIASGRAHVAHADGSAPANAGAWGWQEGEGGHWQPKGLRIGWVSGDELFLEKDASFAEVQAIATRSGEPLGINSVTLHKRLDEQRLLLSTDKARNTLHVRRRLEGASQNVLHLSADLFQALSTDKKPDKPDIGAATDENKEDGEVKL
jgi:hypothetical protein